MRKESDKIEVKIKLTLSKEKIHSADFPWTNGTEPKPGFGSTNEMTTI